MFWVHGCGRQVGDRSHVQGKPLGFTDSGFVLVSTIDRPLPYVDIRTDLRDITRSNRWAHDPVVE